MAKADVCPICGGLLIAGALGNRCPRCLMELALSPEEEGNQRQTPRSSAALPFGDYELLEEIGRGGMGVVYRARQISLNRIVAVKMLVARPFAVPELDERLHLEAETAGTLQHPNIVTIFAFGEHDGQFYFSMEYVAGQNLGELTRQHSLAPTEAAGYVKTAAEAVHHAHRHGILHRDLKPSNLLLTAEGRLKITDFGLAKRLGADSELTLTGQLMGSPNYLSPEQAAGQHRQLTARSDVYSLGAVLYRLLTASPPLIGPSLQQTLLHIREKEAPSPRLLNSLIPRDLETICLKCLEKGPERRYGSALELARDLDRFLTGRPIQARPISPPAKLWRWCRRKPLVAGLSAALLVLLLTVAVGSTLVAFWFRGQVVETRNALHRAYFQEGSRTRESGREGQRFQTLEALGKAAAIRPSLALRNEAIAALALPDLHRHAPLALPQDTIVQANANGDFIAIRREPSQPVRVVRLSDHAELARLPVEADRQAGAVLSPAERFLALYRPATAGAARVQVWDLLHIELVTEITTPPRGFAGDFDPQGQRVGFGQLNGEFLVQDLATKTNVRRYPIGLAANAVRFHPQGQLVAASQLGHKEVVVFDLAKQQVVRRLSQPVGARGRMDWSGDGEYLAVPCWSNEGVAEVHIWETDPWRSKFRLKGHRREINAAQFLPGTHWLWTRSTAGNSRLWCADTGQELLRATGKVVVSSAGPETVLIHHRPTEWVPADLVLDYPCRLLRGHGGQKGPWSVAFSPDGRLLASTGSDGVRLWCGRTGNQLAFLALGDCRSASFSNADGRLFVSARGQLLAFELHETDNDTVEIGQGTVLAPSTASVHAYRLDVCSDGMRLVHISRPDLANVLDLTAAAAPISLEHQHVLRSVAIEPHGRWTVTAEEKNNSEKWFNLWRIPEGVVIKRIEAQGYLACAFSPDGRWLTLGDSYRHRVLSVGDWRTVRQIDHKAVSAPVAAFDSRSRWLAAATAPEAVRILDTGTWTELATIAHPYRDPVSWIAFSPDGTQLAIACGTHVIQLWDLRGLRRELDPIGLDWDQPDYPPEVEGPDAITHVRVRRAER